MNNENNLEAIVNFILQKYHEPLKLNLPIIKEGLDKLVRVHGENHSELENIRDVFIDFQNDMSDHLFKEENILFPMMIEINNACENKEKIGTSHCGTVQNPIGQMEHEHEIFDNYLNKMRELSNNFTIPEDACATFRKIYIMLDNLYKETIEHAGFENDVLHPLAIKKESLVKT